MASQERLEKLRHDIAAAQESLDSQRPREVAERKGRHRRRAEPQRPSWKLQLDEERAPPVRGNLQLASEIRYSRAFPSCGSYTWLRKPP